MTILDPVAEPYALALLECLRTEIAETINPPQQVCMRPGDQVSFLIALNKDECCNGLAWVRVGAVYPSGEEFPQPDETPSNCGPLGWAVTLELGSARCAPTGSAQEVPTCAEWTQLSAELMSDDAAFRRAIMCCFADANIDNDGVGVQFMIGASENLPIEGGCTGITRSLVVRAPNSDCCSVESP